MFIFVKLVVDISKDEFYVHVFLSVIFIKLDRIVQSMFCGGLLKVQNVVLML